MPTDAGTISGIIAESVQTLAIVVGGTWAFLKYVRGRTFRHRAELEVRARRGTFDGESALIASITLTNAGLSRIRLTPDSARLGVAWLPSGRWAGGAAAWDEEGFAPDRSTAVLRAHEAIEPGETIRDEQLLVPAGSPAAGVPVAYRLRATVVAEHGLVRRRPIEWTAYAVVAGESLTLDDGAPGRGE